MPYKTMVWEAENEEADPVEGINKAIEQYTADGFRVVSLTPLKYSPVTGNIMIAFFVIHKERSVYDTR